MAMNYSVVPPSFWTGATGRNLRQDAEAQIVALYLMTSPHANIIGVFRCPIEYMALETGRPIEAVKKGLSKLCEIGFCTFHIETETVWVHEMALLQTGGALKHADKRVISITRFFNAIEDPGIKRAFIEKYGQIYPLPEVAIPEATTSSTEGASEPLESPIEATVICTDTSTSVPSDRVASVPPNEEKQLFDRGKRVLGKNAGGLIVKLKAAKGGNVALARAAIEQASTKENPAEYVAAIIRGGSGPPSFSGKQRPNGGFTDLLLLQHAEHTDDSITIDHDDDEFSSCGS